MRGEVKISGLTDFSDPGQGTNEGRKFIPPRLDVGGYLVRYMYIFLRELHYASQIELKRNA